jgi:GNAT superfamily N-acetyltransferase
MSKIVVRGARHEDVPIIAEIVRKLGWFPHVEKESEQAGERRVAQQLELLDADDSHTVLVAEDEDEGTVAGYVSVHWLPYMILDGPEGYISELFVREEARGKGVGKALLNDIRELAVAKNCSRLMLISSREREAAEMEFYAKFGFVERPEMANWVFPLKER